MFGSKSDKGPRGSGGMETVIGGDTLIQGTIASKGTIRVDGKLEGGISEASSVIIGERGEIQGDVNANSVIIGGRIEGNIISVHSIEILKSADIHGDIKTAMLSIAEGATFEGNCAMVKEKQVIEMNVPASGKGGR